MAELLIKKASGETFFSIRKTYNLENNTHSSKRKNKQNSKRRKFNLTK